jgi:MGT family glycosyltransferase
MARLAVLLDGEQGHLYSTFKLARELSNHGHDVWYFGYSTCEKLVRKHGFKFRAVYNYLGCPQTTADGFPWLPLSKEALTSLSNACHAVNPELFITLSMFCAEALILNLKHRKPVILVRNHFSPFPRKRCCRQIVTLKLMDSSPASVQLIQALMDCGLVTSNSDDLAQLVIDHMPEIVLLPRELASKHLADDQMTYVGCMIDTERPEDMPFPWQSIPPHGRLIYCSFGSNAYRERAVTYRFFRLLIDTMADCPDTYLILSTGSAFTSADLHAPRNVYVTEWAPQIEVLNRVDLMLSHGGIGTVKECLVKGVPMVVFPLMRDQFSCAERLVQLGLALRGDVRAVSTETLKCLIEAGVTSDNLRSVIASMRGRCGVDDSASLIRVVGKSIANNNSV